MVGRNDFYSTVTDAINDLAEHGFDSVERVAKWSRRLKEAAEASMAMPHQMEQMLRDAMAAVYRRQIDKGGILQYHQGIARFTLEKVRPHLRAELDRRILASASLIRLNREQAIQTTLRRFQGWATSIPKGGSDHVDKRDEKADVRKALKSLPFEERRVLIDQGHKLVSSLNSILAVDGGALAAEWRHVKQAGYDGRPEHVARNGHVFMVRGNWAQAKGLMKPGANGYTDDIEQPAEFPFCRCRYRYLYSLRSIPSDMLTKHGAEELARVRAQIAA